MTIILMHSQKFLKTSPTPGPLWGYFWCGCFWCNGTNLGAVIIYLLIYLYPPYWRRGGGLHLSVKRHTRLNCAVLHCIKGMCMTFPVGGAPLGLHHNSLLLSHHRRQHLQLTRLILDKFEKLIKLWVCSAGKHYSSQEILKIISVCKFMQEFVFGEWKRPGFNLEADSHEISSLSQVKYTFKTPY